MKAAASILYDGTDQPYHGYVPQVQCGDVKKRSGDFATHTLRTIQDYAASWGMSLVILFIDLVKAFDRVIIEIVSGWPQGTISDHVKHLVGLGMPEQHAQDVGKT